MMKEPSYPSTENLLHSIFHISKLMTEQRHSSRLAGC